MSMKENFMLLLILQYLLEKIKQPNYIDARNIIEEQVEGGLRRSSRTTKGKRPKYLLNEI